MLVPLALDWHVAIWQLICSVTDEATHCAEVVLTLGFIMNAFLLKDWNFETIRQKCSLCPAQTKTLGAKCQCALLGGIVWDSFHILIAGQGPIVKCFCSRKGMSLMKHRHQMLSILPGSLSFALLVQPFIKFKSWIKLRNTSRFF